MTAEPLRITLRAARINAGLTQEDVAARTGYARSSLRRWETGEGAVKKQTLLRLCAIYGVKPEQIRGGK